MSTGTVGGYTMHHQSCSVFTKGTCTCPPSYKQETAESWHKVHAALLKSVAESQAKLLAGINALEAQQKVQEERYMSLRTMLETRSRVHTGRLDAIGAVLAELLSPKQPQSKRRKR